MRILKTFNLVPQSFHFLLTVGLNLLQVRFLIHQAALLENRHQQLPHRKVSQGTLLPGVFRVKNGMGNMLRYRLFPQADLVCRSLARLLVVETVNFLKAGIGNLGRVLADLDLRDNPALLIFHRSQLVHAAEHRGTHGGDQALAYAEGIDLRLLQQQVPDQIFVQGVGDHNLAVRQPGLIQHHPGLLGQVRQVAAVQADAALLHAHGQQRFLKRPDSVGHAAL